MSENEIKARKIAAMFCTCASHPHFCKTELAIPVITEALDAKDATIAELRSELAAALADAAEAATRAAQPKPCAWKYDDDDSAYATDCGHYICLIEGTPEHNDYKFCPGCGGVISVAPPPESR